MISWRYYEAGQKVPPGFFTTPPGLTKVRMLYALLLSWAHWVLHTYLHQISNWTPPPGPSPSAEKALRRTLCTGTSLGNRRE